MTANEKLVCVSVWPECQHAKQISFDERDLSSHSFCNCFTSENDTFSGSGAEICVTVMHVCACVCKCVFSLINDVMPVMVPILLRSPTSAPVSASASCSDWAVEPTTSHVCVQASRSDSVAFTHERSCERVGKSFRLGCLNGLSSQRVVLCASPQSARVQAIGAPKCDSVIQDWLQYIRRASARM